MLLQTRRISPVGYTAEAAQISRYDVQIRAAQDRLFENFSEEIYNVMAGFHFHGSVEASAPVHPGCST